MKLTNELKEKGSTNCVKFLAFATANNVLITKLARADGLSSSCFV
jgi:hypothetical protein